MQSTEKIGNDLRIIESNLTELDNAKTLAMNYMRKVQTASSHIEQILEEANTSNEETINLIKELLEKLETDFNNLKKIVKAQDKKLESLCGEISELKPVIEGLSDSLEKENAKPIANEKFVFLYTKCREESVALCKLYAETRAAYVDRFNQLSNLFYKMNCFIDENDVDLIATFQQKFNELGAFKKVVTLNPATQFKSPVSNVSAGQNGFVPSYFAKND